MMQPHEEIKNDRFNLTRKLMYCFGTLAQISASVFPNAQMYWKYKFRDTDKTWNPASNTTTTLQNEFTADFAVVGNITTILALISSIIYTRRWNVNYRMIACVFMYILLFVLIVIFVGINTDSWQKEFLYTTLFLLFLISCVNSIFLVALFQMCSKFSPEYISAILSGQALCGIFSSVLQILTLAIDAKPETNGFLYFSATVAFIVLVGITYAICLKFSPFLKYHLKQTEPQSNSKVDVPLKLFSSIWKSQKVVFISFLAIVAVTSMVHPGVTATILSTETGSAWNDTFFVPVITFFMYYTIDLIGRELAIRVRKPTADIPVISMCFLRIILIPLLLFCNLSSKHSTNVVFNSDGVYISVIAVLAFSNGYLINICIIMLPKNYDGTDKNRAVTVIMLVVLLLFGSGVFSSLGLALLNFV